MVTFRDRVHRRWTEEADEQLRTLVAEGQFLPAIAIAMGRTQEACRTRANTLKLPVRSSARRVSARSSPAEEPGEAPS